MGRNIDQMRQRLNALDVCFRPHVNTIKCSQVVAT